MTTPDRSKGDRSHDEVLAGEYVVGVLDATARIAVEERMRRDRGFAAIVHRWEQNLSSFDREYAEEMPPAHLFSRIDAQLHGVGGEAAEARGRGALSSLWGSVVFWRGLTLASICAMMAISVIRLDGPQGSGAGSLVAEMVGQDNAISLIASYDQSSGRLRVTPVASGEQEQRSLELWLVEGENTPVSLGVLPQTGEGELVIPSAMRNRVGPGVAFAVSLEPFGGSPTGKATGPVLAVGQARATAGVKVP